LISSKNTHSAPFEIVRDPGLLQEAARLVQHVVVTRLADDVRVPDLHVQLLEDGEEVDLRLVHELLPGGEGLGFAGLEVHDPAPGPRLELLVGVEEFARGLVEAVEVRHRLLAGDIRVAVVQLARVLVQILDQHAELGSPVADVVPPDHRLAGELQELDEGVADHRGTEVTDVHLLRHVRLGVVDDRRAGVRGEGHTEAIRVVGVALREVPGDRLVGDRHVQEAGAGDLDVLDHVAGDHVRHDLRRQLPGVGLGLLGEGEDAVRLEVGTVTPSQQGVRVGLRQGCREGVARCWWTWSVSDVTEVMGWEPFSSWVW
jgi:hypothetical protein